MNFAAFESRLNKDLADPREIAVQGAETFEIFHLEVFLELDLPVRRTGQAEEQNGSIPAPTRNGPAARE